MAVARLATFDDPPALREDDQRRARTLFELLGSLHGFEGAYYLREEATGRLISLTFWESEEALDRKYGRTRRIYERVFTRSEDMLHLEVVPAT